MTDHDVLDRTDQQDRADRGYDERTTAYFDFLEAEFPDWAFELDTTATWSGDAKPLWIATRDGHHPQAALSAAKLHRRLDDYEARQEARHAGTN